MAYFQKELENEETGERAVIKSNNLSELNIRIENKKRQWERQNRVQKERLHKEGLKEQARKKTEEVENKRDGLSSMLKDLEGKDFRINWDELKQLTPFHEFTTPPVPQHSDFYKEPFILLRLLSFLSFIKRSQLQAEQKAQSLFEAAQIKYQEDLSKAQGTYTEEKGAYDEEQLKHNEKVDQARKQYEEGLQEGVEPYVRTCLEKTSFPESVTLKFPEIIFEKNGKILGLGVDLPSADQLPAVKRYRYNVGDEEIEEEVMKDKEFSLFYDDVIYQIVLGIIYLVLKADYKKTIDLIVLNGWARGLDKSTGKKVRNCILSLQVSRQDFLEVNLSQVLARECFKRFKGKDAGELVNLSPVTPLMHLDTQDSRIIQADEVLSQMGKNTNLATMDWIKFEVLVRDLIGKEFSHEGCKVEVTQASRDNGVDAFAFDEDPIRGGKYVIQAKRYNNLVPVSAVRDLYGTVLNEGAVKGILITTSYYGPEALEFAKDKPLKLINGPELLSLFNKHGYDFKIELTKSLRNAFPHSY